MAFVVYWCGDRWKRCETIGWMEGNFIVLFIEAAWRVSAMHACIEVFNLHSYTFSKLNGCVLSRKLLVPIAKRNV